MMILSFLAPIIASVLYVMVFQKAGFRGAILVLAAGPVAAALLSFLLFGGYYGWTGLIQASLILLPAVLSLAPLAVLAFAAWPPAGGNPQGDER